MSNWDSWMVVLSTPAVLAMLGGFAKFLIVSHARGVLRRNLAVVGSTLAVAMGFYYALPHLPADGPLVPLLFVWACVSPVLVLLRLRLQRARSLGNGNVTRLTHQQFVVALVVVAGFSVWALFQ